MSSLQEEDVDVDEWSMSSLFGEDIRIWEWLTTSLVFIGVYILTHWFIRCYQNSPRIGATSDGRKIPYPPSIGSFPIVGSIPYLPLNIMELHLFTLKKSYSLGGVFSFNIGSMQCIILATHENIHEALVKCAADFAGRLNTFSKQFLNPNEKGIAALNYGAHFKKYHQLSLNVLKEFGFGKNIMEARITVEVDALIANIKNLNGKPFYPKDLIMAAVQSVISSILFGSRIESSEGSSQKIGNMSQKVLELLGNCFPLDILPPLRVLPYFRKALNHAVTVRRQLFDLIGKEIDNILLSNSSDCFVSTYVQQEGAEFDKEQLEYTISDLIIAGTDTSSTTLLWSILILANNPNVQKRLREEIDSVVSRDRLPSLSDKPKMTYVEAAILELMRYKTLAPVSIPHMTTCDTEVGGYFVPKNAMVFPVLYAAHMNVNFWKDPTVFRPERFLDASRNIINKERVIAFSLGKRSCLGELLARQEVFLFFTALVQQFDIRPPEGCDHISEEEIIKGVLAPKPFTVRLIPRSS